MKMNVVRNYTQSLYRESLKRAAMAKVRPHPALVKLKENTAEVDEETYRWPRRIFSGIQPTGPLHLGNYLGAVQKWAALQDGKEIVTYCIADLHSITLPQNPQTLRDNILELAATMLACGIDPAKSNIFVQSAVKEHSELCWILSCLATMARLGHLPQYKEKSRELKEVPMGIFAYPVLQAADIMLYKSTHVPVGEDQVQHIQLAQHLARAFNSKFGSTFPTCEAIVDSKLAARIRCLRNPSKKMSKSTTDRLATVYLSDEPELIVQKFKKAVTDFMSDVTYDPEKRTGVSNLITIHSLVTGKSIEEICDEAQSIDTGMYKLRVADAVVEFLKPVRCKIKDHLMNRRDLIYFLEMGAEKASQIAKHTMDEVRDKVGLGTEASRTTAETVNPNMLLSTDRKPKPPFDTKPIMDNPSSAESVIDKDAKSSSEVVMQTEEVKI